MTINETFEIRKAIEKGICYKHTGKMSGMISYSTSVLNNGNCDKYRNIPGSVCSHCYAAAQLSYQDGTAKKAARNTELITKEVYPAECFPQVNALYFRFEAFGDINNETQVKNYFKWATVNPHTTFALWTKNAHIIQAAINDGAIKPENLIIIYSSLFVNDPVHAEIIQKKYSFVDKVFSVYSKDYAEKYHIGINCGGRHCAPCLRCYKKETETAVSELLK